MNFPNLAILQPSISGRPVDTLKLSLHSKTSFIFLVSCKNKRKKPLTLWSEEMKIWFLFARRISHRAFGIEKLLQWKKTMIGMNQCYPKNTLMRLLLLPRDWRTPGTLNNQQLSPVLLLALEQPHGTRCICPAFPPSSLGLVRLTGLVLTTARHSVQCGLSYKGKKPPCDQPIYIFFHTSSFFSGACPEAGQTWQLIRAKLFPVNPIAVRKWKVARFQLEDLTNCTDDFSSRCSPLWSLGHKANHPIFS